MHPEPFHLGPVPIAPYGIAIAVGLYLAIVIARRENDRTFFLSDASFESLTFWTVVWGFLVSRLFYIVTQTDYYVALCTDPESVLGPGAASDCFAALKLWEGGLVYYGGPLGSIAYMAWALLWRREPGLPSPRPAAERRARFFRYLDACAPGLSLAHAFGRMGCLFAGCCYGLPFDGALAIHYPEGTEAHLTGGVGRYPVPLMEAGFEALLFCVLIRMRPVKRFHGQIALTYLMVYPPARMVFEMYRGDKIRGYLTEIVSPGLNRFLGLPGGTAALLTTSQFISLVVAVVSLGLALYWRRKAIAAEADPAS